MAGIVIKGTNNVRLLPLPEYNLRLIEFRSAGRLFKMVILKEPDEKTAFLKFAKENNCSPRSILPNEGIGLGVGPISAATGVMLYFKASEKGSSDNSPIVYDWENETMLSRS
jgi:hypothetical protein